MTHWLFMSVLFNFQEFGDFIVVLLFLISSLILVWSKNTSCMSSSIFFSCWCLLYDLGYGLSWWVFWMFHGLLERMCVLLLIGVFYKYELKPMFNSLRCLLIFCPVVLPIAEEGVITIILGLSIYSFTPISFFFMCFEALLFGTHT